MLSILQALIFYGSVANIARLARVFHRFLFSNPIRKGFQRLQSYRPALVQSLKFALLHIPELVLDSLQENSLKPEFIRISSTKYWI